ncbi:protein SSX1 [Dasypus novemcinctus]|uniref:protein SSX1 n=1 Tax=Dasypus novemcinctus TaxID=9361 RepID=UPI00265DEC2E|nr:protein SSX1 [Dasypus novemcinctus]
MNRGNSFKKSPKDTHRAEKKSKALKDISRYFSKEEWSELGYSEKVNYVYMKRNYDTMTNLGLKTTIPDFMCPNRLAIKYKGDNSDEDSTSRNQNELPQVIPSVQKKKLKMMSKKPSREENDSKGAPEGVNLKRPPGSEQTQKQLCPTGKASTSGKRPRKEGPNAWAHRLRERKTLVSYEEISDPEEED